MKRAYVIAAARRQIAVKQANFPRALLYTTLMREIFAARQSNPREVAEKVPEPAAEVYAADAEAESAAASSRDIIMRALAGAAADMPGDPADQVRLPAARGYEIGTL